MAEPADGEVVEDEAVSWADTLELIKPGVVRISTADCYGPLGSGSGFLVAETLAVTNAHVVSEAAGVSVGPTAVSAQIIGLSEAADLALLRLDDALADAYVFAWVDEAPREGDDVAALGFPTGGGFSSTRGSISGLEPSADFLHDTVSYLQTDASVNPGNSGGPLVTMDGDVAGVIFAKRFETDDGRHLEGMGYAVSVEHAERMVSGWIQDPQVVPPMDCDGQDDPDPWGSAEIEVAVESSHDFADVVTQSLVLHGTAINRGWYDVAFALFTDSAQERYGGLDFWKEGLSTSYWRQLHVSDVEGSEHELVVEAYLLTEQAAEFGHDGQTCTVFELDYTMLFDEVDELWLIDRVSSRDEPQSCQ